MFEGQQRGGAQARSETADEKGVAGAAQSLEGSHETEQAEHQRGQGPNLEEVQAPRLEKHGTIWMEYTTPDDKKVGMGVDALITTNIDVVKAEFCELLNMNLNPANFTCTWVGPACCRVGDLDPWDSTWKLVMEPIDTTPRSAPAPPATTGSSSKASASSSSESS